MFLNMPLFLLLLRHFSHGDVKKFKNLIVLKTADCPVQAEHGVLASLQLSIISQKLCTSQLVQSKVYVVLVACLWYRQATVKGRCKTKPLQLVKTKSDFRIIK
jgi:hypothetical protein